MATTCDRCGVKVSTSGYLGGGIVCHTCAKVKRHHREARENR